MITAATFTPALQIAQLKPLAQRTQIGLQGMVGVLDEYLNSNPGWWANRWADGLGDLDGVVTQLRAAWIANGNNAPAWGVVDPLVDGVLNACTQWLSNRKWDWAHIRITKWRKQAVTDLYWKTAWAYSCGKFAADCQISIPTNNTAGTITSTRTPVNPGATQGNPYAFGNGEYTYDGANNFTTRAVRGDSRGPLSIWGSDGFQAMHLNNFSQYKPFFSGNANHDTISVTCSESIAINAATNRRFGNTAAGNLPAWFPAMVTGDNIRGFVYTFNLGTTEATRVTGEPLGREHIYLGLPNQSIAQWWAVRADKRTFGPLPYNNAELTAGAGHNVTTNPGWSTNPLELA